MPHRTFRRLPSAVAQMAALYRVAATGRHPQLPLARIEPRQSAAWQEGVAWFGKLRKGVF